MTELEKFTASFYGLEVFDEAAGETAITDVPKLRRASGLACERVFFEAVCKQQVEMVLEAGCFDGHHSRRFIAETQADVLGFEPNPFCYPMLNDLIENQRFSLVPCALSEQMGMVKFLLPRKIAGLDTERASGKSGIDVRRGDTDVETALIATVTGEAVLGLVTARQLALWLDTEGHAIPALRGFGEALQRFSFIMVEVEHKPIFHEGSNATAVFEIMNEQGFVPSLRDFFNKGQCNVIFVRDNKLSDFKPLLDVADDINQSLRSVLHSHFEDAPEPVAGFRARA